MLWIAIGILFFLLIFICLLAYPIILGVGSKGSESKHEEYVEPNGLSTVESYVDRLLQSRTRLCSLFISYSSERCQILMDRYDDCVTLRILGDRRIQSEKEKDQVIRAIFKDEDIAPFDPCESLPSWMFKRQREIMLPSYQLPNNSEMIKRACLRVLREAEGLSDEAELRFVFREHE